MHSSIFPSFTFLKHFVLPARLFHFPLCPFPPSSLIFIPFHSHHSFSLPSCLSMPPPHIPIESRMASIGSLAGRQRDKPLMVKAEVCGSGVRWSWMWWEAVEQWSTLQRWVAARTLGAKPQVFYQACHTPLHQRKLV